MHSRFVIDTQNFLRIQLLYFIDLERLGKYGVFFKCKFLNFFLEEDHLQVINNCFVLADGSRVTGDPHPLNKRTRLDVNQ